MLTADSRSFLVFLGFTLGAIFWFLVVGNGWLAYGGFAVLGVAGMLASRRILDRDEEEDDADLDDGNNGG